MRAATASTTRNIGRQRQIEGCLNAAQIDALHAAREILDVLVFEDLWHGDGEREGGKREIVPLQT
jgi:hypothetical protein